jgi:hypothetical protein
VIRASGCDSGGRSVTPLDELAPRANNQSMSRRSAVRARALIATIGATWLALLASCASSTRGAAGIAATPRDRTLMDTTDLAGHGYANAYAAVVAARPEWLRAVAGPPSRREANGPDGGGRFPTSRQVARATGETGAMIGVFVEGSRQPVGLAYLGTLSPQAVLRLQHLSASEAMATYGPEWAWGAIIVRLRE